MAESKRSANISEVEEIARVQGNIPPDRPVRAQSGRGKPQEGKRPQSRTCQSIRPAGVITQTGAHASGQWPQRPTTGGPVEEHKATASGAPPKVHPCLCQLKAGASKHGSVYNTNAQGCALCPKPILLQPDTQGTGQSVESCLHCSVKV